MNMLEEFDQKLADAASKLESMANDTQRVRSINDLLETTDNHWNDSISRLSQLQESMRGAAQELNKVSEAVMLGKEVLEKADPSKIILRLEEQSTAFDKNLHAMHKELVKLGESSAEEMGEKLGELSNQIAKSVRENTKRHDSLVELVSENESRAAVELRAIKEKAQMAANISGFTLAATLGVAASLFFLFSNN